MTRIYLSIKLRLVSLFIFGIAMGIFEAIVVIYLRQIYYPQGFELPVILLPFKALWLELLREASTIVMLVVVGILTGRNMLQRFAMFLFAFAIWDIFYYIGLKALIDWPLTFFDWDILFLIPVPWLGPVIVPLICSTTMIALAGIILYFEEKKCFVRIEAYEWLLIICGSSIILSTFIWDYSKIIFQNGIATDFSTVNSDKYMQIISSYVPVSYNWLLFVLGEFLILYAIAHLYMRYKKIVNQGF